MAGRRGGHHGPPHPQHPRQPPVPEQFPDPGAPPPAAGAGVPEMPPIHGVPTSTLAPNIEIPMPEIKTDAELEFHYFRSHDLDHNNKVMCTTCTVHVEHTVVSASLE